VNIQCALTNGTEFEELINFGVRFEMRGLIDLFPAGNLSQHFVLTTARNARTKSESNDTLFH
jgi:hypothetical protein